MIAGGRVSMSRGVAREGLAPLVIGSAIGVILGATSKRLDSG